MATRLRIGRFLEQWRTRTMRSQLELMKKVAAPYAVIENCFSTGCVRKGPFPRALTKVSITVCQADYPKILPAFVPYEAVEIALYHNRGCLPEPDFTHRFW